MFRQHKLTLLLLGSCLLNGCDSHYHTFDGRSGYKFETLNSDTFSIQFFGNGKSSQQDVQAMWHHKARELCKGGAYIHKFLPPQKTLDAYTTGRDSSFLPKDANYFTIEGEVNCLAPTYGVKLNAEKESLLSENLSADKLIGRRATN